MQRFVFTVLVTLAFVAATYAETTCQNHQRNSRTSAHTLSWNITCDANGDYLPMQCTSNKPEWCACYNKERSVTTPSMKRKFCDCELAKDQAPRDSTAGCDYKTCAPDGKFARKQCCATTGKCYCVDPMTGAVTTQPTNNANLNCPAN